MLLFIVVTRILTFAPLTSAVTSTKLPFVPTIAYSVIATLSEPSRVTRISDTSVWLDVSAFTKNLPER